MFKVGSHQFTDVITAADYLLHEFFAKSAPEWGGDVKEFLAKTSDHQIALEAVAINAEEYVWWACGPAFFMTNAPAFEDRASWERFVETRVGSWRKTLCNKATDEEILRDLGVF